jgi:hypothetical protein
MMLNCLLITKAILYHLMVESGYRLPIPGGKLNEWFTRSMNGKFTGVNCRAQSKPRRQKKDNEGMKCPVPDTRLFIYGQFDGIMG